MLTPKQRAFADYYIESLNASQSYAKAYNRKVDKTCEVNGARLLVNAKIKAYIGEHMRKKDKDRILSQDETLEILTRMSRGIETEQQTFTVTDADGNITLKTIDVPIRIKDRLIALAHFVKIHSLYDNTTKIEPVTFIIDIPKEEKV